MSNVLSEAKKQQVIALGRLGWPLRRIEQETGVRRETAGAYLKAAGIGVRPPGAWGRRLSGRLQSEKWILVGSPQAGPKTAAILSVVESCRRLKLPVRHYLAAVLPGLADRPIQRLPDLTPAAWVTQHPPLKWAT